MKNDIINHPQHYTFGSIEVIDVIEDWQLSYHLGNAIKYLARCKYKGKELEDLHKAKWYLKRVNDESLEAHSLYSRELKHSFGEVIKDWSVDKELEKIVAAIFFGNCKNAYELIKRHILKIEMNQTEQISE